MQVIDSERSPDATPRRPGRPLEVLVLSASIAEGHNAAARAACRELSARGHHAAMVDGLRAMSPWLDAWLQRSYARQLERLPWSYEVVFRVVARPAVAWLIRLACGLLFGRR
ncbi:MAG: hypothetical protein IRY97_00105, partial [Thermomicrobiaceae bacterium]|nr:hypothetical protein [Thermomicrobiaceae bacterium]